LPLVRRFDRIRIVSRDSEHARALAADHAFAEAVDTVDEALRDADVVVTATSAPEPVVRRDWLKAGVHINAVGACFPHTRELDAETVAASEFFVDRRESAENEAGDYLLALRDGAVGNDHIRAELGEVLVGAKPGRSSPKQITVFESLGIAVEDLYAAEYVVRRARETGRGTELEF
jgi:ornithine cyclodeaminase/alanine dehydrogenase-like protein (mu-crystallin family)